MDYHRHLHQPVYQVQRAQATTHNLVIIIQHISNRTIAKVFWYTNSPMQLATTHLLTLARCGAIPISKVEEEKKNMKSLESTFFFFRPDQLMTSLQQSQSHAMKMSPSSMHLSPTGTDNSVNDLLDDSPSKCPFSNSFHTCLAVTHVNMKQSTSIR